MEPRTLVTSHSQMGNHVNQWRDEIDGYLTQMQAWSMTDPATVMQQISSIGARLIEIRTQVVRSESRLLQGFRTKELDPLLNQVEFQFKIHSRRLSSMTLDWQISGGQAT